MTRQRKPAVGDGDWDGEAPLMTVAGAMASGQGDAGTIEVLESNEGGCVIRVAFGEPRISKSGGSYLVTYDTTKLGALKIAVTAYIPIPKGERPRQTHVGDSVGTDEQRAARMRGAAYD